MPSNELVRPAQSPWYMEHSGLEADDWSNPDTREAVLREEGTDKAETHTGQKWKMSHVQNGSLEQVSACYKR
jgi:hypothetical protein